MLNKDDVVIPAADFRKPPRQIREIDESKKLTMDYEIKQFSEEQIKKEAERCLKCGRSVVDHQQVHRLRNVHSTVQVRRYPPDPSAGRRQILQDDPCRAEVRRHRQEHAGPCSRYRKEENRWQIKGRQRFNARTRTCKLCS